MTKTSIKTLAKRVLSLRNMIDYQEDAIVSKTLVDRKTGTVTLFAFDKGQGLSEHTVPYDVLIQILEGRARITIESKVLELKEGEAIIMPANSPHTVEAIEKFKMLLVLIKA